MPKDELNMPLGVTKGKIPVSAQKPTNRPSAKVVAVLAGILAMGSGAVWLGMADGKYGGRAQAIAKVEVDTPKKLAPKPQPDMVAAASDKSPTGSIAGSGLPRILGQEAERVSGVKVVRRGGGDAPGALIISIPEAAPSVGLPTAPDSRLIRQSRYGLLPIIGSDGSKAIDVYARPLVLPGKLRSSAPRISIVIGGMGLSEFTTERAIKTLPAAVSLAFAPYGKNLNAQTSNAREAGHEILLQVPMEPFDLAGSGPGPQLLKTQFDRREMKERLHWHMGRFTGYIGIANFLGAKFSADPGAMAPVIEETRSRGLMYFDDGSSPRSLAGKLARASQTPFAQANVIIDEQRDPKSVDAALLKLESIAVREGSAIGFANALPSVIDKIAKFCPGLEKRGVALVPVSALSAASNAQAKNGR